MFNDSHVPCIDCNSEVSLNKSHNEKIQQTEPYTIVHRSSQIIRRKETTTQCDPTENDNIDEIQRHDLESNPKLLSFLKKVEQVFLEELGKHTSERTFKHLKTQKYKDFNVDLLCTLKYQKDADVERVPIEVTWNSTGVLLGIAFGLVTHEDWCFHSGCIAVWNLAKGSIESSSPDHMLESGSCMMCAKFHPSLPSLLAGGTFSGEILIWNLSVDSTATVGIAGSTEGGHMESVSQIDWLDCHWTGGPLASPTPTRQSDGASGGLRTAVCQRLVSIGSDGRLLVWRLDTGRRTHGLVCLQSYQIRNSDQLPPTVDYPTGSREQRVFAERRVSLTCFALSPRQPDRLVLGTACGGVLLCSLAPLLHRLSSTDSDHRLAKGNEIDLQQPSPVELALFRHSGPVTALDWSKFHRNLVLSCAAGHQVQLHNILQRNLTVSLDYGRQAGFVQPSVLTAQFSPVYASLLVCASNSGQLSFYNLNTGSGVGPQADGLPALGGQPVLVLRVQSEPPSAGDSNNCTTVPVMTLAMNRDRRPLIAVASPRGEVNVWKPGDTDGEHMSLFNAPVQIEQLFSHLLLPDQ